MMLICQISFPAFPPLTLTFTALSYVHPSPDPSQHWSDNTID